MVKTADVLDISSARLALVRIGPCEWAIDDLSRAPAHPHRRVAHVRDDDTEVVVDWGTDVPLPERYLTAEAALEDLQRWLERRGRDTRPIPIAHFPPPIVHRTAPVSKDRFN